MTKEEKAKLSLGDFVKNIREVIAARTHLMREWALKWVLAPLLCLTTIVSLFLLVADATGAIKPMRSELVSIVKAILVSETIGGSVGAGFGWLFDKS